MAILVKGQDFADGEQITATKLDNLVDNATFASGAVETGGGIQLNGSGQLKVAGNIDIGSSNLTATGTISLGTTSFNDNNITNVGSIALDTITNDGTDVTIDSSGDITLDAGGADIRLKDDGTQFGRLANSSSDLVVASSVSDKDILFQGSDSGSTITALTLDMSAAGAATFNDKITAVGTSVFTNLDISGDVDVDGTLETDALSIASTAVTATAAELNYNDTGASVGTVVASKTVTVDSNKDVSSFRNITLTGELDAGSLDVSGDIDVDGTTNLDAVDIDGAVQLDSTLTVGVNDTGYDVKFFGATSGAYMLWDESQDDLILGGAARLGVGSTAPDKALVVAGAGAEIVIDDTDTTDTPRLRFRESGSTSASISTDASELIFDTGTTERVRIDASGNVGINNTNPTVRLQIGDGSGTSDHVYHNKSGSGAFPGITDTTSHGIMLESQGANGSTLHVSRTNSAAGNFSRQGTGDVVTFHNTSSSVTEAGSIEITGATSVAYQTSSDYRLKENVVDIVDGIDRVKQLKPVKFNFIDEDRILDGFLAHEVSDIVPEAIGGEKDAMKDQEYEISPAVYEDVVHPAVDAVYDEDGTQISLAQEEWTQRVLVTEAVTGTRSVPDYQGIDQSKLVPLLTAALQEAVTKIEALEARVQTLEG